LRESDEVSGQTSIDPSPNPRDAVKRGRVFCVVSAKGVSGKTILTASLAALLTDSDKTVLVIDTDFSTRGLSLYLLDTLTQGNSLSIQPESGLADSIMQRIDPSRITPLTVQNPRGEFHIILPNGDFRKGGIPENSFLGGEFSAEFERSYFLMLGKICERFRHAYDYILIDTRGGYDYSSKIPATLADGYVVALEADSISVQQVLGLKTGIDEFSRNVNKFWDSYEFAGDGAIPNARHLGFIVNKALFTPQAGEAFSSSLTSLFGGRVFGTIPADRNAIRSYQNRDIPYQKFEGTDFSYYSVTAFSNLLTSDNWKPSDRAGLENISAIARRWRFGRTLAKIQQVYPTTGLFILLLAFAALFGYQNGNSWAKSNLIVALVVLCLGWSIIAMLVGAIIRANEVGRKLIPLALPALVTALSLVFAAYAATHGRITFSQDIRYSQIQELNRKLSEGESTVLRLEPTIRSNTDSSGPL